MKLTYLIGAGASFHALPIINEFKEILKQIAIEIQYILENNKINIENENDELYLTYQLICIDETKKEALKFFYDSLTDYISKIENFRTIDTYAKYLFIKNDDEFYKFKLFTSFFFILFQTHFNRFKFQVNNKERVYKQNDFRYSDFLTNIMSSNELPNNLKILSWNYDFQFQIALKDFFPEQFEKDDWISNFQSGFYDKKGNIFLYQLNGIANHEIIKPIHFTHDFSNNKEIEKENQYQIFISNLFMHYKSYHKPNNNLSGVHLKYAWERELHNIIQNKDDIPKHLKETTHLVIIGYSFPFTNRKIDKEIFDQFDHNKLESIVYQNPNINFDINTLLKYFKGQLSHSYLEKFIHIKECDNFYIPYEYNHET